MNANAKQFNQLYEVGTLVRYFPIIGQPDFRETQTRSLAWTLPSGQDVVQINGLAGCVSLQAVEVIRTHEPTS